MGGARLLLCAAAAALHASTCAALLEPSLPIWHATNISTLAYVYFRSPEFTLPIPLSQASSALLYITAAPSPNIAAAGSSTKQSKLLEAFSLRVNGVPTTAGPGHSVPQRLQAVSTVDVLPLLRDGSSPNILAIASYFNNRWGNGAPAAVGPKVQAVLTLTATAGQAYNLSVTGPDWLAFDARPVHNPTGDTQTGASGGWFHAPQENLDATARPVGWELPGYVPSSQAGWTPVAVQPPFTAPLYLEPAAPPAMLWRTACSLTPLPNPGGTCGTAAEGETLTLSCPAASSSDSAAAAPVITAVLFASYGTPSGSCSADGSGANNFTVNATCNSANSVKVVAQACMDKTSCSIVPSNTLFGGDPCDKTAKHLSVAVNCSSSGGGGGNSSATLYHYLVDFGQELMGGVNITFPGVVQPVSSRETAAGKTTTATATAAAAGPTVTIKLGEELLPSNSSSGGGAGGVIMVPTRAGENFTAVWTLVPWSDPTTAAPANTGLHQHEFLQFRWAEIVNSPVPLITDDVRAWVVQHPFDGTGVNPWETPCARSTPNVPPPSQAGTGAAEDGRVPAPAKVSLRASVATQHRHTTASTPTAPSYGWFSSSLPGLDAVFNLTAYTAVATSLDINVDSQTRQRDLCHIDALITGQEQYAVFPPGDYAIQRRTFRDAFGNDSAIWGSWTEFKQSGALMAVLDALETGDTSIAQAVWSDDDNSIVSDAYPLDYNSLQFYAGLRYWNTSGTGLLHYPAGCGGSWACDPLVDWPTNTRDGYVISDGNPEDAVRNGLGAVTIAGLSQVASWIGKATAAARYSIMVTAIQAGILQQMLTFNNSGPGGAAVEAYFTDGANQSHAAVHSTVYGVISGAADGNATLAPLLSAYLIRRNVVPSSCMTGRWYVQALYQLSLYDPAGTAADFGLELLSRTAYPSWGNMILRGATTTLEAWQPEDKWNTDWAHPWCASPAFLIPRWLMGVQPLQPAWARWRVAPQPGNLTQAFVRVPTPVGAANVTFTQGSSSGGSGSSGVQVVLFVPAGTTAQVCLPPLHPGLAGGVPAGDAAAAHAEAGGDGLVVDGQAVPSTALGRLLCTITDVGAGSHTVQRTATA